MSPGPTQLALTLLGSVALLLWGVRQVRIGVTGAFGTEMRRTLAAASASRWRAFVTGGFVSGLLQSSTATALLVGAFAGQGLVALPVALAMMLGADVGSTIAAQVLAFDIKGFWAALVALGVGLAMAFKSGRMRGVASIAMGVGMMLLSLREIGGAASVLQHSDTFKAVLTALADAPTLAVVVMAMVTWAAHSSLAMILFTMTLAGAGAVPPALALAMVVGANLGGAAAPFVALSGSPVAARRVPLGNLIMRGVFALALIPVLDLIAHHLGWLGPDPARLVVNAHTAFNLLVALFFLPLLGPVANLLERLLPEPAPGTDAGAPRHLDPNVVSSPPEALACAMRETLEIGNHVANMLRRIPEAMTAPSGDPVVGEIEKLDDVVDRLFESLKLYLVKVSQAEMSEEESARAIEIMNFATNLEHIGDIVDKNLMELAAKRQRKGLVFSSQGRAEILSFHALVMENMALALNVFATRDIGMARRLVAQKAVVRAAEREATESHYARLRAGRPESIESSAVHLDILRDLKRIHGHIASTAYPILEAIGEMSESRLRKNGEEASAAGSEQLLDRGAPA